MSKVLIALIAGFFGTLAVAQTAAPAPTAKERQQDVQSTTQSQVDTSGSRAMAKEDAKNTAASKKKAKPTTAQRQSAAKGTASEVDTSGSRAMAKEDAKNTAASKAASPQK